MRALPLSGVTKYQDQQQEVPLATNDVVVLMSASVKSGAQGVRKMTTSRLLC